MATLERRLEQYLDREQMYHFTGEKACQNLNKITNVLGYRKDGFKYGSSLERFLQDNPGACEAIVEWIGQQQLPEWIEAMTDELGPIAAEEGDDGDEDGDGSIIADEIGPIEELRELGSQGAD
jgi:hypothetical protein